MGIAAPEAARLRAQGSGRRGVGGEYGLEREAKRVMVHRGAGRSPLLGRAISPAGVGDLPCWGEASSLLRGFASPSGANGQTERNERNSLAARCGRGIKSTIIDGWTGGKLAVDSG